MFDFDELDEQDPVEKTEGETIVEAPALVAEGLEVRDPKDAPTQESTPPAFVAEDGLEGAEGDEASEPASPSPDKSGPAIADEAASLPSPNRSTSAPADEIAPVSQNAGVDLVAVGKRVQISGLKAKPEFNGMVGHVVDHDAAAGRFEVQIEGSQNIRCKPENLTVVAGAPDCQWKKQADEAFKRGDYDCAVDLYGKSFQEHGAKDVQFAATLRSNKSATLAKKGDYEGALQEADLCVELRPKWAKGHARRAMALFGLNRFADSRDAYCQSVTWEPLNESYLSSLSSAVAKAVTVKPCPYDAEEATRQKNFGNDALKAGNVGRAIAHYTASLAHLKAAGRTHGEEVAIMHSNRSAAFSKLMAWDPAFADGQHAITCNPQWPKAHVRCGVALLGKQAAEEAYKFLAHAVSMCPGGYLEASQNLQRCLSVLPLYKSPTGERRARRFDADADKSRGYTRIFAISDVHIDHSPGHEEWAKGLSNTEYKNDILIVAGDLGDTLKAIERGLGIFKSKFRRVFYTPGNHDMWLRPNTSDKTISDSVAKLLAMMDVCDNLGAEMLPAEVMRGVYVVPLLSWYNYMFDENDPTPGQYRHDKFCKWPMDEDHVWKWMLSLNDHFMYRILNSQRSRGEKGDVITFSHFLPRVELPYQNIMNMCKAMGCKQLETQLMEIKSSVHIFGHSHCNHQRTIRGVRYIQFSLNNPDYGYDPKCPFIMIHDGHNITEKLHNVY